MKRRDFIGISAIAALPFAQLAGALYAPAQLATASHRAGRPVPWEEKMAQVAGYAARAA